MMMSSRIETEEDHFRDACHDISSSSSFNSDSYDGCPSPGVENGALDYEFWTKKPDSVDERRGRFLKWMGLSSDCCRIDEDEDEDSCHGDLKRDIDRSTDGAEVVLANLDCEQKLCSSHDKDLCCQDLRDQVERLRTDDGGVSVVDNLDSKQAFFSSRNFPSFLMNNTADVVEDVTEDANPTWKIKNLDSGTEFIIDELAEDGTLSTFREVGSNKRISVDEFQKILGPSALVREFLQKESKAFTMVDLNKKEKANWIQKLSAVAHITHKAKGLLDKPSEIYRKKESASSQRVYVHVSKKHSKELTSLYTGQEIPAHEGSVLTMKFSPDGQYLASGGVDGVVRVWKVVELDITNKLNTQDFDSSCLYFSLNQFSKLAPLPVSNEKNNQRKSLWSSDPASVVLPPKVFQLSEKPLHEYHGHQGEVLALSWSKNGNLLSCSADKTARLWQVGHDGCLGVFSHNNYVTCIDFNPRDDNRFISGSIDGKLRVWEVESGRVIDWTDMREIVTAICYCPDGQGGIVGSMDGNCRFYDVIDNRLQLGAQICLKGKKKLSGKRITGFQFCPSDTSKVIVTSAGSQVQILCGTSIICKLKGNKSSGSQVPASFTSDGEHVVSVGDDSNVRVWNYTSQEQKSSRPKALWSCESFVSRDATIAVPWGGLKKKFGTFPMSILKDGHLDEKMLQKFPTAFPDCFSSSLVFFLDALSRGSATWPEEKLLPRSNPLTSVCKSEFKLLKNSLTNALNSPHLWGLVVVTAGLDGCIRTFLNYGLPIRL